MRAWSATRGVNETHDMLPGITRNLAKSLQFLFPRVDVFTVRTTTRAHATAPMAPPYPKPEGNHSLEEIFDIIEGSETVHELCPSIHRRYLTDLAFALLSGSLQKLRGNSSDTPTAREDKIGLKALRYACELGDREAQYRLGAMLSSMDDAYPFERTRIPSLPQNDEEAVKWLSKAQAQNFPLAFHDLGHHYLNGLGCRQDDQRAVALWKQGSELPERVDYPNKACCCMKMVADMYARGRGVDNACVNCAREWLAKAVSAACGSAITLHNELMLGEDTDGNQLGYGDMLSYGATKDWVQGIHAIKRERNEHNAAWLTKLKAERRCDFCGAPGAQKKCGACSNARYYGKKCQKRHYSHPTFPLKEMCGVQVAEGLMGNLQLTGAGDE